MDCGEFQKSFKSFINGNLGISKREEFIRHLMSCKDCNEEFEIYYIILSCVKTLEENEGDTDNYHKRYEDFISENIKEIKKYKAKNKRLHLAFFSVVTFVVISTGISITPKKREERLGKESITDSDFTMKFRFKDVGILKNKAFEKITKELYKEMKIEK